MLLIGLPAAALVCLWSIFNTADWMMLLKYKSAQVKNLWGLLLPRRVKPKVLTVAHKIGFSCSPSWALWSRHTRLCLSVTRAGCSGLRALALPVSLPPRYSHDLPFFFSFRSLFKRPLLSGAYAALPSALPFCFFFFPHKTYYRLTTL